jgi:hypothetical protein
MVAPGRLPDGPVWLPERARQFAMSDSGPPGTRRSTTVDGRVPVDAAACRRPCHGGLLDAPTMRSDARAFRCRAHPDLAGVDHVGTRTGDALQALLNDPEGAESICLDILDVDPDNQDALVTIILALSDQFGVVGSSTSGTRWREYVARLTRRQRRRS